MLTYFDEETRSLCDRLLDHYPRDFVEAVCTGAYCHRSGWHSEVYPMLDVPLVGSREHYAGILYGVLGTFRDFDLRGTMIHLMATADALESNRRLEEGFLRKIRQSGKAKQWSKDHPGATGRKRKRHQ